MTSTFKIKTENKLILFPNLCLRSSIYFILFSSSGCFSWVQFPGGANKISLGENKMIYDYKIKKAKRNYQCNKCKRMIKKGEEYLRLTSSSGSTAYHYKCMRDIFIKNLNQFKEQSK